MAVNLHIKWKHKRCLLAYTFQLVQFAMRCEDLIFHVSRVYWTALDSSPVTRGRNRAGEVRGPASKLIFPAPVNRRSPNFQAT